MCVIVSPDISVATSFVDVALSAKGRMITLSPGCQASGRVCHRGARNWPGYNIDREPQISKTDKHFNGLFKMLSKGYHRSELVKLRENSSLFKVTNSQKEVGI